MKVYIVVPYYKEYNNEGYGSPEAVFTTRELAQRYINDWPYRKYFEIEEIEVKDSYEESFRKEMES